jgi:uncharacterized caspase-like protein
MLDATWHYAVVVGIDQYPRIDNGNYDLRCPLEDARQMERWLTSPQGGNLDTSRVKVLTRTIPAGRNPPVPVLDEVNSAILDCAAEFVDRRKKTLPNDAARKKAWQNSRFYFYISGHGMDGDADDAVLITANASRDSLNHISTRNVLKRLKKDKVFGELVVLADCCRDLASVDVQDLPWDLRNYAGFNDPVLPRSFVAYASRHRKKAYEPPPGASIQNSIFTQALLEGLQGGVAGNKVDSKSLEKFLYNCVPDLAKKSSKPDQNPEIKADPDIVFVQISKSYQINLTPRPGSAFAGLTAVDVLETDQATVRSRVTLPAAASGVFTGTLPTGFYITVPEGGDPMAGSPFHAFRVLGEDKDETIG